MAPAPDLLPGAESWAATGSGPAAEVGVAVVHGFTGNPNSTAPLGRALHEAGYTVAVPRLPGHGTSVRDLAGTGYGDWRGAVDDVLADLADRTRQVVLVGLSMGGTLCLDVASRRPPAVAGAVAINAQVLDPQQPLARVAPLLQYLVPALPRGLAGLPADDIARPGADERAYGWVPTRAAQSLIAALPRIRARLADLHVPLLVAHSPEDHTVPPANSEVLPDLVGSEDVSRLVLERSYHVATLDWDADRLKTAVIDFVGRVTGR